MGTWHELTVGEAEQGLRLDQFLKQHLPQDCSRTQIQRLILLGRVHVDGHPAKAHRAVHGGSIITVQWTPTAGPPIPRTLVPEPIPLDIVYEDDVLLVVDKPAGLVTHPAPGHWTGTLVNAVLWHLQQRGTASGKMGNGEWGMGKVRHSKFQIPNSQFERDTLAHLRPGIVHRLDKETSGLLLVAKRLDVQRALQQQIARRMVRRTYVAVVEGWVKRAAGTIDAPLGRHPRDRKRMAVLKSGGRRAVTHYRVLGRGSRPGARGPVPLRCTALEVTLETGRTHQIRVHLASLGHPVVGDAVYGHAPTVGEGLLLHARALAFRHPVTKQPLELSSPLPSNMQQLVAGLDTSE